MDLPFDSPLANSFAALLGSVVCVLLWLQLFTAVDVSSGLRGNSLLLVGLGVVAFVVYFVVEVVNDSAFSE